MAEGNKTTRTREVTHTVTQYGIELFLSEDEAQLVADVLSKVAGSRTKSRREYADSVTSALGSVGITYYGSSYNSHPAATAKDLTGWLKFSADEDDD